MTGKNADAGSAFPSRQQMSEVSTALVLTLRAEK